MRVGCIGFAGNYAFLANPVRVRSNHRFKSVCASAALKFDIAGSGFGFDVPALRAGDDAATSGLTRVHLKSPQDPTPSRRL
jgi:hypothetical protein